jgi:hypothetical protein
MGYSIRTDRYRYTEWQERLEVTVAAGRSRASCTITRRIRAKSRTSWNDPKHAEVKQTRGAAQGGWKGS